MRALIPAVLAAALLLGGGASGAAEEPMPATADAWLAREHLIFRRYLNMVRQAQHDFENGYPTPQLIVVLARDLFITYVASIHQVEHRVLYPLARSRLTKEQQPRVEVLRREIRREFSAVRALQRSWEAHDGSRASPMLAEVLDALARGVNRHMVVQEEVVFPVLYALKPEEQAAVLGQLAAVAQQFIPRTGRARTQGALDYIEERIRIDSPRKW